MRKRIVLLSGTTLFALMLTFAGCGKKEEPSSTSTAAASACTSSSGRTGGTEW